MVGGSWPIAVGGIFLTWKKKKLRSHVVMVGGEVGCGGTAGWNAGYGCTKSSRTQGEYVRCTSWIG